MSPNILISANLAEYIEGRAYSQLRKRLICCKVWGNYGRNNILTALQTGLKCAFEGSTRDVWQTWVLPTVAPFNMAGSSLRPSFNVCSCDESETPPMQIDLAHLKQTYPFSALFRDAQKYTWSFQGLYYVSSSSATPNAYVDLFLRRSHPQTLSAFKRF